MAPSTRQQMPRPPPQQVVPTFHSPFKASHPYFYFVHRINAVKAELNVEVIGPNLTFTFTHSRAFTQSRLKPSEIASALERKTVGFLATVNKDEDRHILAWAESGHGLGRSGELLDVPEGGPVLSSELWTRRVIRVGKILGLKMRRGFDNQNNSADPSLDIDGIFQGSHVEAKLAVHAIWVLLEIFDVTKDLNNVTEANLRKLRGATWKDGTSPMFEIYFSRKNCPPCGTLVKGLSELTGIEIKLFWKDRLTLKQYYKQPKSKEQAKAQKKAYVMQRDAGDFDDDVSHGADYDDLGCSSDDSIVISEPDTPMDLDEDNSSETIVIDDDPPGQVADRSANEAIDLTKDEAPDPPNSTNAKPVSKIMQERQEFMEEMERYSAKANSSPVPEPRPRQSARARPLIWEEPRQEIRKPIPPTSVEANFVTADQWEQGGPILRRRFPRASGGSAERLRSASPRRWAPAARSRPMRRRGSLFMYGKSRLASRTETRIASQIGSQGAGRAALPATTVENGHRGTFRAEPRDIVDLSSEAQDTFSASSIEGNGRPREPIAAAKTPEVVEVNDPLPGPPGMSTPDLLNSTVKSPTRCLFPEAPAPRIDLSSSTFPSPKPVVNARPANAPEAVHHDTPQLKRSFAQNAQQTQVLHYPTPKAASEIHPPGQSQHSAPLVLNCSTNPGIENGLNSVNAFNRAAGSSTITSPISQPAFNYPKPPPSSLKIALAEERERHRRSRLTPANLEALNDSHMQNEIASIRTNEHRSPFQTPTRPKMGVNL